MKWTHLEFFGNAAALALLLVAFPAQAAETARDIPVIHDVDVVVVGGSSGAVEAACAAARAGASVFLAAPRPYLGDDVAGTLRLWLEPDDHATTDLGKRLYGDRKAVQPFTYTVNRRAEPDNPDPENLRLNDGIWNDFSRHSVQYAGAAELEIVADLGKACALKRALVYAFANAKGSQMTIFSATAATSADGTSWTADGKVVQGPGKPTETSGCFLFEIPLSGKCRYVKLTTKPYAAMARQWLGEIVIETDQTPALQPNETRAVTTPLNVKKTFDAALLDAGVRFLTGAYGTEIVTDDSGATSGVVITDRSGRQAVKAKVVIDATPRGVLARQTGAQFRPFPAGTYTFSQVVLSGNAPKSPSMDVRMFLNAYDTKVTGVCAPEGMPQEIKGRLFECRLPVALKDGEERTLAEAQQAVLDKTFTPTQLDAGELPFAVFPDSLVGKTSVAGPWKGAESLDLNACCSDKAPFLYVLSPLADVSREAAAILAHPVNLMALGQRVGGAAAEDAKQRKAMRNAALAASSGAAGHGDVREVLQGLLPNATTASGKIHAESRALPVLAECDVLVIGGGTAGSPAAISAGRQGMKTIVCEYQYALGGVATVGLLGSYYFGNPCGFTLEIDDGVKSTGAVLAQSKAEWYRRQCRAAKEEVWLGSMGCGALVDGNKVTGAVVVGPNGRRGLILAKAVIDSTGNADIAAAAGVETEFINADELSLQGATMNMRQLGSSVTNTDISFVDDTDAFDMCFFSLRGRQAFAYNRIWDQSQLVDSRERRRLIGAYIVQPMDFLNSRTFPDTIVQCNAPHDTHGQNTHELLLLSSISGAETHYAGNLPYRALLPQTLDGLLVTGLGISAHRDAIPVLRMQRDVQNQGYAAGYAATLSVRDGVALRNVDIKKLQSHLIEKGILKPEVLNWTDKYPLSDAAMKEAVKALPLYGGYGLLWRLIVDTKRAIPMLIEAYNATEDAQAKARYATVLAMFGDATGVQTLVKTIELADWDQGWDWKGMGAYGRKTSYMDSYIIALSRVGGKAALAPILKKAQQLTPKDGYSHFRAIALACERIGDKSAAKVLAGLLSQPGISGYALSFGPAFPAYNGFSCDAGDKERTLALREICLARALFRLGDADGKGEAILRAYVKDPRSAYARHALMVLESGH
jgi:hypothetical protein